MKKLNHKVLGIWPLLVLLLLIGLIFLVMQRVNKKTSTNTISSQTSSTVSQPIKKAEEIKVLNQDLDTINIDQELNTSDLDTDINAVL